MRAPLTTILVDMDDTILAYDSVSEECWQEAGQRFQGKFGALSVAAVIAAVRRSSALYWSDGDRHREGRLNLLAARRRIVGDALVSLGMGSPVDLVNDLAACYEDLRNERIHVLPGALEALRAMRTAGYTVALVTNGALSEQEAKIERFGLRPLFDAVFIEGGLGFGKPDRRLYEHALTTLDTTSEATCMIGDNWEWEVLAPRGLGLTTVWVNRTGRPAPPLPPPTNGPPVYVIPSLAATQSWWTDASSWPTPRR